jgi:hypothetical protein
MAGMRSMKKYEVGILVNQQGSRFVDEGEYPSDKTYAKFGKIVALTQSGGVAYVIFDSATKETINPDYTGPDRGPIEARSIRELATKLEIDPDALEHTVTAYNDSIQGGKCPSLRPPKTNFARRIERSLIKLPADSRLLLVVFGQIQTVRCSTVVGSPSRRSMLPEKSLQASFTETMLAAHLCRVVPFTVASPARAPLSIFGNRIPSG